MSEEGFLRRWARLKSGGGDVSPAPAGHAAAPPAPAVVPAAEAKLAAPPDANTEQKAPPPSLEDAARLTPDADFSAFVARDVDKSVQRLALKKLFADPHFNAIDGLDMYMSDYNKPSPLTPGMLASLKHAPGVLSRLLGEPEKDAEAAPAQEGAPAPEEMQAPVVEQEQEQSPVLQAGQPYETHYKQAQQSIQQGNA